MKKYTVIGLAKKIELENETFNSATNEEKRVTIAEDCLIRLQLKQVDARRGDFCKFNTYVGTNVKTALQKDKQFTCIACAKGSLFLSYIGRVNNYNIERLSVQNNEYDAEHIKLLEIFSIEQLALIEMFYEGKQYINKDVCLDELLPKVMEIHTQIGLANNIEVVQKIEFGNYIYSKFYEIKPDGGRGEEIDEDDFSTLILIYICNNIIKNKGTFRL
jgi:hypothetical protein